MVAGSGPRVNRAKVRPSRSPWNKFPLSSVLLKVAEFAPGQEGSRRLDKVVYVLDDAEVLALLFGDHEQDFSGALILRLSGQLLVKFDAVLLCLYDVLVRVGVFLQFGHEVTLCQERFEKAC